jgi:alpha-glucosidase
VPDGEWYLHLFDTSQPDFNWNNPEVGDEMESVIRFWLDRGVDGFRIDVAHGLVKKDGLPDAPDDLGFHTEITHLMPMWDQDGVHDIYRRWRKVCEEYGDDGDHDRILCGEAWVQPADRLARYIRDDELHQTFNFDFLMTPWLVDQLRTTITDSLAAAASVQATQTWVLSNHDVVRHASRLGFPATPERTDRNGIGIGDPQPDAALGLRRARAATTVMLALPGSAYLYQGEELGLPEATELPDDVRQDPTWEHTNHEVRGRDGCRVPVPWQGDAPAYGFNETGNAWLPQPASYGDLAVDRQQGVPGSTLELYRELLRVRRAHRIGRGLLSWPEGATDDTLLRFDVTTPEGERVTVLANLGDEPLPLPAGRRVLVRSDGEPADAPLGVDAAAWLL